MLVVVVYLYAASVAQWAMEVVIAFTNIHSLLMVHDLSIPDRAQLAGENMLTFSICQQVLFMFNVRDNSQPHVSTTDIRVR
jgi:hypothetical protein